MTAPPPAPAASSAPALALPEPPRPSRPRWVDAGAPVAALLGAVAASSAQGRPALVPALAAAVAALVAHGVAGVALRRRSRSAALRWRAALDETEAACGRRLESRLRSLRHRWPTSADLVERLRHGDRPPVTGARTLVVLGTGAVASGLVLAGDGPPGGDRDPRVEALRARLATLDDGPLCVDAARGVHVVGPALLVESLAGGYRAQLRHRGASVDLVTWRRVGAGDDPGGGAPLDDGVACVVEVSAAGAVAVVRRDGVPCAVPLRPSWTSSHDAPAGRPVSPGGP